MRNGFALLVLCLLTGHAWADNNIVEIYGRIDVNLEFLSYDDAAPAGTPSNSLTPTSTISGREFTDVSRLAQRRSHIGFRGVEPIHHSLAVTWQCESTADVTGDSATTAGFCQRNSKLGLRGDYGELFGGIWDTPYKLSTGPLAIQGDAGSTGYGAILGSPGFGVSSSATGPTLPPANTGTTNTGGFNLRVAQSLNYHSSRMAGFQGRFALSANQFKDTNATTANKIDPYLWSMDINYDDGRFYFFAAYEEHHDYFGLTGRVPPTATSAALGTSSEDTGFKLGAQIKFGMKGNVGGGWERLEYERHGGSANTFKSYDRDAFFLTGNYYIGRNRISAMYSHAENGDCEIVNQSSCDTHDLGADHYMLILGHSFSKRSELYAAWVMIDNDKLARYNFANGGLTAGAGADPTMLSIGLAHTF